MFLAGIVSLSSRLDLALLSVRGYSGPVLPKFKSDNALPGWRHASDDWKWRFISVDRSVAECHVFVIWGNRPFDNLETGTHHPSLRRR